MNPRTWARRAVALAAATLTLTGLTTAVDDPAHAGQVGVTISITGAGLVQVVEGTPADGVTGTCDGRANVATPTATITCGRIRSEATLAAWLWLRATPYSDETGSWSVAYGGWQGCDQLRTREGRTECGVHSGAFSSDERTPSIRFIDTIGPTVTWLTSTVSATAERSAIFSFGASEPGTLACRFDDDPDFRPCSSPLGRTFATDGPKKLEVVPTDRSGNVGPVATTTAVIVDTALTTTPGAVSNNRSADFGFTSGGGTAFTCSLDRGPDTVCGSGRAGSWALHDLTDGRHTVQVAARSGTTADPVPATHTWTVDTIAPQTTIAAAATDGRTGRFAITSPGATRLECRLTRDRSADAWVPCADPVEYDDLADASYVLEVRGIDAAGNVDATPASHAWTVRATPADPVTPGGPGSPDVTAPDTVLTSGPAEGSFVLADHATLGFAASEPGPSWRCTLDGTHHPCTGGSTELGALGSGTHRFTVASIDPAGNVDPTPATRTWTVPLTSAALKHGRGWRQKRSSTSWGGSVAVSRRHGAALSVRVGEARAVALIAATGPKMGKVKVYAGKRLLRTVRLRAKTASTRRVLPVATLPASYSGRLRVVVASRRGQVRVEGLGVAS
jgi:hypothetical protein